MDALFGVVVAIVLVVVIFLAIRQFWWWYWGISTIHQLLREQLVATRELHEAVKVTNMIVSHYAGQLAAPTEPPASPTA